MASLISFKNKISKFHELPHGSKIRFIKYFTSYPLFLLLFRLFGFKRTKTITERLIRNKTKQETRRPLKNYTEIINYSVNNNILKSTCLERSLFTCFILGLNGIKSDIKIGVKNDNNEFTAHAWVEGEDLVIDSNPDANAKFSTF